MSGTSLLHSLQMERFLPVDFVVDLGHTYMVLVRNREQLTDGGGQMALALLISEFLAFDLRVNLIQAHIGLTGNREQLVDGRDKLALVLDFLALRRIDRRRCTRQSGSRGSR